MQRMRQGKTNDVKIKQRLRDFVEGKFVTILMTIVTLFALVGDDIRLWLTDKSADPYFFTALITSFFLFLSEILINTVVTDEFKYSFFFWLDIIATFSLIIDITWITDVINKTLVDYPPSNVSVNAIPGIVQEVTSSQQQILKVIKALRLIRLIRIIKLYKYISQQGKKEEGDDRNSKKKKKKKKQEVQVEKKDEEQEESLFKKETNPSKLGKALGDSINKKTIIGVLLMLMVLPLLTHSDRDFSDHYAIREAFWFGRSSCLSGFKCENNLKKPWLTNEGWYEVLRGITRNAMNNEGVNKKELLWLYCPNFEKRGSLDSIKSIPYRKSERAKKEGNFWNESEKCAGFKVSPDCPWRYEEMMLVSYTPKDCLKDKTIGCDQLVTYARFQNKLEV